MGKFTKIPQNTFTDAQLNAGVLLRHFDPETVAEPADEDIICATTGGITATCAPTYSDMGEDVDNCPAGTMEGAHLDSWECRFAFTAVTTSPELIKMQLGAADIDSLNTSKIIPRRYLKQSDFADSIWWVGDKAGGGCVAVELKNALSLSGFSVVTTKNGKGNFAVELKGYASMNAQNEVPMEFYSLDDTSGAAEG